MHSAILPSVVYGTVWSAYSPPVSFSSLQVPYMWGRIFYSEWRWPSPTQSRARRLQWQIHWRQSPQPVLPSNLKYFCDLKWYNEIEFSLNYRCFHCARRFASLNGLEKHRASESHIHRCPKCSRVLKSGRLLRQHLKKRHIPHKVSFILSSVMLAHLIMSIHSQEKPKLTNVPQPKSLSCPECSKRFSRTFLLNRHLATVHRLESQFHCSSEGCGKQFKREDKFRAHMLTHTNFKPHLCSQCGKTH